MSTQNNEPGTRLFRESAQVKDNKNSAIGIILVPEYTKLEVQTREQIDAKIEVSGCVIQERSTCTSRNRGLFPNVQ